MKPFKQQEEETKLFFFISHLVQMKTYNPCPNIFKLHILYIPLSSDETETTTRRARKEHVLYTPHSSNETQTGMSKSPRTLPLYIPLSSYKTCFRIAFNRW